MAVDNTYQGPKGQDNDGQGIFIPAGVELNSYLTNTYIGIDKELKGGLHYIKYLEDLTDNSYAGILSSRVRIGMLAYCHQEYNGGNPVFHEKYYRLKDLPHTNILNWEELTTGSTVSLNKVGVVPTFNDLALLSNPDEGWLYNVIDARQEVEIFDIESSGGQTFICVTDIISNNNFQNDLDVVMSGSSYKSYKDISIGSSVFIDYNGSQLTPGPISSTEYKVGNYSLDVIGQNNVQFKFELLDDQGDPVNSSTWDTYSKLTNNAFTKRIEPYTLSFFSKIITNTPLVIKWLRVFSGTEVDYSEVILNTAARHNQNTDIKLSEGTADEVTANEIRTFIDNFQSPGSALVPANIDTDTLEWDGNKFGLPIETKTLVPSELTVTWDAKQSDNTTPYTFVSPNTTNSQDLVVETGCVVDLTNAQFKYQLTLSNYAPSEITGDFGVFSDNLANIPPDNTFTNPLGSSTLDPLPTGLTSNSTYSLLFTKSNVKKLKVDPATWNVYLSVANETNSKTFRVRFGRTVYFGYSANDSISTLGDLNTVTSSLINNTTNGLLQVSGVQTDNSTKIYGYFLIADSFGNITSYVERFPSQSETVMTFNNTVNSLATESLIRLSNINITTPAGTTESYRVYRINAADNYQIQTQYLRINF
jgi:hypothetical protein